MGLSGLDRACGHDDVVAGFREGEKVEARYRGTVVERGADPDAAPATDDRTPRVIGQGSVTVSYTHLRAHET